MQLRHIRPGSLEWQDAKIDEGGQGFERLTPEETERLRKLSDDRRRLRHGFTNEDKNQRTHVQ
jgi:hypothetical protein